MPRRAAVAICLAVCLIFMLAVIRRPITFGSFSPPPFDCVAEVFSGKDAQPVFFEELLPTRGSFNTAHVSSICEVSNGGLLAVWYAGSKELADDVGVYGCSRAPGKTEWSEPEKLVDPGSASRELKRFVRKVGNPVIWSDAGNRVYLLYVSTIGGWSSSALNLKTSDDGGRTWTPSVRLTLSPFFNFGELVRNQPVPLQGGGFMVPIYHEFIGKFPEILWLLPDPGGSGFVVQKTRINHSRGYLQPSFVTLDSRSALAFLRSASVPKIGLSSSSDDGLTWQAPQYTGLPNPDSGICAVRISGGRLLIIFNDCELKGGLRDNLRLAVSDLHGKNWTRIATLEDAAGQSFAYPFVIRTSDGLFHIVFSYNCNRIKHLTLNEAWIEERIREAGQPRTLVE
jgi:predicted neuraminidase